MCSGWLPLFSNACHFRLMTPHIVDLELPNYFSLRIMKWGNVVINQNQNHKAFIHPTAGKSQQQGIQRQIKGKRRTSRLTY